MCSSSPMSSSSSSSSTSSLNNDRLSPFSNKESKFCSNHGSFSHASSSSFPPISYESLGFKCTTTLQSLFTSSLTKYTIRACEASIYGSSSSRSPLCITHKKLTEVKPQLSFLQPHSLVVSAHLHLNKVT
ncbi:uncharacterized protein DS421_3g80250 [Arachis hypogaea]|nr:uncharacterized protein DS421_3g80250 [Arachis hypogaea]